MKNRVELFGAAIAASLSFSLRSHSLIIFSFIFLYFIYRCYSEKVKNYKLIKSSILLVSPIIFWIVDNSFKSGYPLFPSKLIRLETKWTMGIDDLNNYVFGLRKWTYLQTCYEDQLLIFGFNNITCVFLQTVSFRIILLALAVAITLFVIRAVLMKNLRTDISFVLILILFLIPVFTLLIYAPQLRFMYSYVLVILVLIYAEIINGVIKNRATNFNSLLHPFIIVGLSIILAIYPIYTEFIMKSSRNFETDHHKITSFQKQNLRDESIFYYYVGTQCGFKYFPCTGVVDNNIRIHKSRVNIFRFDQPLQNITVK